MLGKSGLIIAGSAIGVLISFAAQAFPALPQRQPATAAQAEPVAGGCGLGFHRGPYGYCVPNGAPYRYAPYGYYGYGPPPVYVPPPACPYGYHYGPYGRCYPY